MNEAARLVLLSSEIQQEIMRLIASGVSYDDITESGILDSRDAAKRALRGINTTSTHDGLTYDDNEVSSVSSFTFEDGERVGIPNSMSDLENTNPELLAQMSAASESWIRRLSSSEIGSVLAYADSSLEYAEVVAKGFSETHLLHGAISKAPSFVDEVTVYSGLSEHMRAAVLSQIDAGEKTISLNRAQSASVNPAQVNGFMASFAKDGKKVVPSPTAALEIVTTRGAVMTRISQSPHEMEILLPPARYEVLGEMTDVTYKWADNGMGRVANRVIQLRMIDD